MKKRIAIVGAGCAGLSAAWAFNRHPDRFEFELYEKTGRIGGNAITVPIPQDDGSSIPIDIAVTAFIPSVYQNYLELLDMYGIKQLPSRFSYTVDYGGEFYAHDFDSSIKRELQPEIDKFMKLLAFLKKIGWVNRQPSVLLSFMNPFNYLSMGKVLNLFGFSSAFRNKILKPLFINFVLATNIFDMPASMFSRYLDFFSIEGATPIMTWDQGTQNIYKHMTADFTDRIHLNRGVAKVLRDTDGVTIIDEKGNRDRFDEVVLACNANQALMMLDQETTAEQWLLGSIRYESELHNHAVVHTDASVLPDHVTKPLETRSTYIRQYGSRPDNYEITYIIHNQQPWAKKSDKPCLVTYNAVQPIDESKVVFKHWYQHVIHDVFHTVVLLNALPFIQGQNRTWYCGAHTIMNSQEHCFISGVSIATQMGADYPWAHNEDARKWFNFYGRLMHGLKFNAIRARKKPADTGGVSVPIRPSRAFKKTR